MKGLLFILVSVVCNVIGQLSMKYAMIKYGEVNFQVVKILNIAFDIFTKPFIILGLFCYFISAFFWIIALSKLELSLAYPMMSIGYVLIFFLSWWLFKENVTAVRFLGVFLICLGLYFLARR